MYLNIFAAGYPETNQEQIIVHRSPLICIIISRREQIITEILLSNMKSKTFWYYSKGMNLRMDNKMADKFITDTRCGQSLRGEQGRIKRSQYRTVRRRKGRARCSWRVQVKKGKIIKLSFQREWNFNTKIIVLLIFTRHCTAGELSNPLSLWYAHYWKTWSIYIFSSHFLGIFEKKCP